MHIVFDFDDTLTNTTRFWNCQLDLLETYGVDRECAIEVGEKLFQLQYSFANHATELGLRGYELDEAISKNRLLADTMSLSCLFPDVIPFLEKNKSQHTFSILTFGDPDNQTWRLSASKIDSYFNSVRFAGPEKYKVDHLKEFVNEVSGKIIFVDDSPNELLPVHDAKLPIELYRIVRPHLKHDYIHELDDVAWTRIKTIDEILFE